MTANLELKDSRGFARFLLVKIKLFSMSSIKERAKVMRRIKVEVGEDFIVEIRHGRIKIAEVLIQMSAAEIRLSRGEKPKLELKTTVL